MKKRMTTVLNKNGFTLLELIVSIMVLSLIMIAITTVFTPALQAFSRANNLAEANTLLDNVATLVMDDVINATEVIPGTGTFTVKASHNFLYYTNGEGILCRSMPGYDSPVLPRDYYKYKGQGSEQTVFSVTASCAVRDGLVTITLTLTSDSGWSLTRDYTAKPVGL